MVLEVMRLGEPVLMKEALPVRDFGSPRLRKLVADMWDTMHAEGGVGIAAPQVGVSERIICFGFEASSRYPDAPAVPQTVLINPTVEVTVFHPSISSTKLKASRRSASSSTMRTKACACAKASCSGVICF